MQTQLGVDSPTLTVRVPHLLRVWGATFLKGNCMPCVEAHKENVQNLLHPLILSFLQFKVIPMPKRLIWGWHVLIPFAYNGGPQVSLCIRTT